MEEILSTFNLQIRHQIYQFFAGECRAPSTQELSVLLDTAVESVEDSLQKLHARHMILLEPGVKTDRAIRMANPFSAVPTNYRVISGRKHWWANCAWDSLGIPAALGIDARIEARLPGSQEMVALQLNHGHIDGKKQVVYFSLPCSRWYDDLVFT